MLLYVVELFIDTCIQAQIEGFDVEDELFSGPKELQLSVL